VAVLCVASSFSSEKKEKRERERKLTTVKAGLMALRTIEVLLVGDSGTGKTSLLRQLSTGGFSSSEPATVGVDARRRTVDVDGVPTRLCCYDLGGAARYHGMVGHYARDKLCVVLVCSVVSEESFRALAEWRTRVLEHAPAARLVVLANQVDRKPRVVSREQLDVFCGRDVPLVECTATDRESVENAFAAIIEAMIPPDPSASDSAADGGSSSFGSPSSSRRSSGRYSLRGASSLTDPLISQDQSRNSCKCCRCCTIQ
jgi:small GTP-binding protein